MDAAVVLLVIAAAVLVLVALLPARRGVMSVAVTEAERREREGIRVEREARTARLAAEGMRRR